MLSTVSSDSVFFVKEYPFYVIYAPTVPPLIDWLCQHQAIAVCADLSCQRW